MRVEVAILFQIIFLKIIKNYNDATQNVIPEILSKLLIL